LSEEPRISVTVFAAATFWAKAIARSPGCVTRKTPLEHLLGPCRRGAAEDRQGHVGERVVDLIAAAVDLELGVVARLVHIEDEAFVTLELHADVVRRDRDVPVQDRAEEDERAGWRVREPDLEFVRTHQRDAVRDALVGRGVNAEVLHSGLQGRDALIDREAVERSDRIEAGTRHRGGSYLLRGLR
jgi:hypothetical protein